MLECLRISSRGKNDQCLIAAHLIRSLTWIPSGPLSLESPPPVEQWSLPSTTCAQNLLSYCWGCCAAC